jgi:hypothetical protein
MIMAGHSGKTMIIGVGFLNFLIHRIKIALPTPSLNVSTWDLTITWALLNVKDLVPMLLKKRHTAWEWESAVPDKSLVLFKRNQ